MSAIIGRFLAIVFGFSITIHDFFLPSKNKQTLRNNLASLYLIIEVISCWLYIPDSVPSVIEILLAQHHVLQSELIHIQNKQRKKKAEVH